MKLLRILFFLVLGLAILAGVVVGGASWWVMRKLGPEVWIRQAESAWNCRAQIEDSQINLFARPATLSFKNVSLAPRDAEVAKPYAQRTPLAAAAVPIHIPEAVLEVTLEDLLQRRLNIHRLRILQPAVRESRTAEGDSSLEVLFRRPGSDAEGAMPPPLTTVTTAPPPNQLLPSPDYVPRAIPVDPNAPASVAEALSVQPEPDEPSFAVRIAAAAIEGGSLHITNRDTVVDIRNLNFSITDLDISPGSRSQAEISSEITVFGAARINGVKQQAQIAYLRLTGHGDIQPIDVRTGDWNPTTVLKLTLARDSILGGHMTMGDAAGKDLRKLQEYGVDLSPVPVGGPLLEDAILDGSFQDDQFTLLGPTRLVFPEYEVVLEANSWINATKDRHDLRFRLSCSPQLQQRLEAGIAQARLGESIARAVTQALADERGRMTFDIVSSGPLSDPEVKPSIERVLNNLLRGQGLGDLLKGLLKKL